MPTTRPRYSVTDTGATAELLDVAQRAWPELSDRKQLLLRLAEVGAETVAAQLAEVDARAARQRAGLERATNLVDPELLLGEAAWR